MGLFPKMPSLVNDDIAVTGQPQQDVLPDEKPSLELPSPDAQAGVRQVEAVTLTWTKGALIAVFIKFVKTLPMPQANEF